MSSEVGDLYLTLQAVTDPFTASLTDAAGVGEDATSTISKAAQAMAEQLDASSKIAADSFKIILDVAVELAEGIVEPLASVKASVRSVASALRALAKAAGTASDVVTPAFGAISGAAEEMAATVKESLATADASLAGLDSGFGTAAAAATTAATEMKTAGAEGAAAATASGDAAAASASQSSDAMGETASGLSKYALGLAAAGIGVFEAIKGATQFNAEITTLNTQANVAKGQLASLGSGVLNLAGQVGQNPDSLAEALFHVESTFSSVGIKGPAALNLLRVRFVTMRPFRRGAWVERGGHGVRREPATACTDGTLPVWAGALPMAVCRRRLQDTRFFPGRAPRLRNRRKENGNAPERPTACHWRADHPHARGGGAVPAHHDGELPGGR